MTPQPPNPQPTANNPLTYRQLVNGNQITQATKQSLVNIKNRPNPPRGLRYASGVLQWETPADPANITHYRIYANNEGTLVRQVPAGQLYLNDNLVASRVFVSSFNANSGLESIKVLLQQAVSTDSSGSVTEDGMPVTY